MPNIMNSLSGEKKAHAMLSAIRLPLISPKAEITFTFYDLFHFLLAFSTQELVPNKGVKHGKWWAHSREPRPCPR